MVCLLPQSNQRGIETALLDQVKRVADLPQSNQRGIETVLAVAYLQLASGRLNRTSVGLKPERLREEREEVLGLNRTSVGLKQTQPERSHNF